MAAFDLLTTYCILEILLLALPHYIHLPPIQLNPKTLPLGE